MEKILRKILRVPLESPAPDPVFDPDLDLQFARDLALDHRITFTRASQATVVDSDGTLKWAGHNLLLRSEFDAAAPTNWTVGTTGTGTVTLGSSLHNLPTLTFEQTVSGREFLQQSHTFEANTEYKLVLFVDESASSFTSGSSTVLAVTNLDDATGTISASLSDAVNGVLSISFTTGSDTSGILRFGVGAFNNAVAKLVCAGIHLYKADKSMQQRTDVASGLETYYPTTSSAVYAARFDHDGATKESLGLLLEGERTNLLTYSEDFTQYANFNTTDLADQTTSPEGSTNAAKLSEAASTGLHYIQNNIAFSYTSGDSYTHSVFLKAGTVSVMQLLMPSGAFGSNAFANYDLTNGVVGTVGSSATASIEDFGNGWFRCVLTATATATSTQAGGFVVFTNNSTTAARAPSYAGDTASHVFIFGNQLEENPFVSSYIPTSGATATRARDLCDILTNSFRFSETEGSILIEAEAFHDAGATHIFYRLHDGSNDESTTLLNKSNDTSQHRYQIRTGGSQIAGKNVVKSIVQVFRSIVTYKKDNFTFASQGESPTPATSGTPPTGIIELSIGKNHGTANVLFGHIRTLQYFARQLDDETILALSQPSLEPSLSLVFDSSETSFVDTELTR